MLLEQVYQDAPTVRSGKHRTTVNEFTDQIPALRPEVLREATERLVELGKFDSDKILVEEDKGAILGGAVSLAAGLPLAVARWYTYAVGHSSIPVPIDSEYFSGTLYVNGIEPGDRVTIVDDTISTGGTLIALVEAVQAAGATVSEVLVAVEKPQNGGREKVEKRFGIDVRTLVRIAVDDTSQRAYVLD
ncbi:MULTISPECIES: phosphoribosyltransferase family protein [Streptomyces]|uniref:Adenine phosphoribosyltransferase n=1 Tax=Streptomyces morookaense TaxID=1970 RepID=A0A7Y7E8C8_STRMO|nr:MULTISPECIES: phosphoribosyltransferase family protein [Streptomyces]MCC2276575.1 adenine phosphoribosyltransferase [Streptomyces sp. ET3-23]NVK79905.1 adenine phosphoribosyltransferase [Streptomyces morookaense]GHF51279.1 adenine phosphoribosyltransferase [Streptomyces morookaense]